jgi:hypothetical protein
MNCDEYFQPPKPSAPTLEEILPNVEEILPNVKCVFDASKWDNNKWLSEYKAGGIYKKSQLLEIIDDQTDIVLKANEYIISNESIFVSVPVKKIVDPIPQMKHLKKVRCALHWVSYDFAEIVEFTREKYLYPLILVKNDDESMMKNISRQTTFNMINNIHNNIYNIGIFRHGLRHGYSFVKKNLNLSILCLEETKESVRELFTNIIRRAISTGNDTIIMSESYIDQYNLIEVIYDLQEELSKGIKHICFINSHNGGKRFNRHLENYRHKKQKENKSCIM